MRGKGTVEVASLHLGAAAMAALVKEVCSVLSSAQPLPSCWGWRLKAASTRDTQARLACDKR